MIVQLAKEQLRDQTALYNSSRSNQLKYYIDNMGISNSRAPNKVLASREIPEHGNSVFEPV
jgi:hypothetical protein